MSGTRFGALPSKMGWSYNIHYLPKRAGVLWTNGPEHWKQNIKKNNTVFHHLSAAWLSIATYRILRLEAGDLLCQGLLPFLDPWHGGWDNLGHGARTLKNQNQNTYIMKRRDHNGSEKDLGQRAALFIYATSYWLHACACLEFKNQDYIWN